MTERAFQQLIERGDDPGFRDWLESRRWFADKGRGITGIAFDDVFVASLEDAQMALAIADVSLSDGTSTRYLLSLALPNSEARQDLAGGQDSDRQPLLEAAELHGFAPWLLERFIAEPDSTRQSWTFSIPPGAAPALRAALAQPATLMRAEQSNTSLRFGDAAIVKLTRRLQPGPNPDAEILKALAGTGFEYVPRFLGEATWRSSDGDEYPFALVQAFVPNEGDGWTWMLRRLEHIAAGEIEIDAGLEPERQLGKRTAELHASLSLVPEPAFVPEIASETTIEREVARITRAGEETVDLLAEFAARAGDLLPEPLSALQHRLRQVSVRAAGMRSEIGLPRIRVHGDFHLGQTLRRPDQDWMIIDFEGEPARPVAERRLKSSPLKDVAGMLRSFAYARRATERAMTSSDEIQLERLAHWERNARREFVAAYRDTLHDAGALLVPEDTASFQRALAAWELDKALYEIAYEARNRPDWIDLPLRALVADTER